MTFKRRVDLASLNRAASGDQSKKVTVTKAWLRVIHQELTDYYSQKERKDELDPFFSDIFSRGRK